MSEKESVEPPDYFEVYVWACSSDPGDPCGCSQARIELSRAAVLPLAPRRRCDLVWAGTYFSDYESGARAEYTAAIQSVLPGLQRAQELPAKILDNGRVTWVPVPKAGE